MDNDVDMKTATATTEGIGKDLHAGVETVIGMDRELPLSDITKHINNFKT